MKSIFRATTLVVAAAALFLLVGAASMATAGSKAKVTISVASLRPGSSVNLDADVLAKYLERLLGPYQPHVARSPGLTEELLRKQGF